MNQSLNELLKQFDTHLKHAIKDTSLGTPLEESMRYSLEAGGKRIRPLLMLSTIKMLNHHVLQSGFNVALALEMIHTYSLIHDDLPAMDDDDLRRGKPTNHTVYGEWLAILAGDALLTKAFEVITQTPDITADAKVKLIQKLSQASGHCGMVGGQTLDMQSENRTVPLEQLEQIHIHKTGALIQFSIEAATIMTSASPSTTSQLIEFSRYLGVIFQIKDDLLDICGDVDKIGKPVGSDATNNKSTYVTLLGVTGAEQQLQEYIQKAETILKTLSHQYDTTDLKCLLALFYQRQS
ncbi:polyprenyl synthetase family protein [Staphylococcus lutrae]|uniref:Farnesyl diphosphate synthase n=1 Tax=Staphylococcus lutrae TaxID=155085 RepID=A0AAC9RUM1_9STAP|nr:farnesyl diphosphate synthase [Staphylococcus lutrae]ARJ51926.1 geranyl transferase [Staphylococcus lutrae]PNZ37390.1 polyprenyl synthetase family protein [Staphylococcus lutrae]